MTAPARFVGSIPELYDRHMGPCLFEPYARDIVQRVPPGARRALEVAAGTGRVTRHLLRVLPADAQLIVTDLNQPMLDVNRQRTTNDPRLRWQVADMLALPLPDDSVEAVVCQFGLMFAPDKAQALAEMRRVLSAGGILLASTWDAVARNPASELLQRLAAEVLPASAPEFMLVPFSMFEPRELERLATEAGFRGVRVDTVALDGESESAAHLAAGFVRGTPLNTSLVENGVDIGALEARVAAALGQQFGDAPCKTPLSAHVLTAFA